MRWLLSFLVACTLGSSTNSAPSPSSPVLAASRPTADPIEANKPIAKTIKTGDVHRYRVELPAGGVARGVVMQKSIDLTIWTYGPSGKKLAEIDGANGDNGPEPLLVEASVAGAYDFEIRTFAPPPNPGVAVVQDDGTYEVRIDEILTGELYAEIKAKQVIDSPRLLEVWRAVNAKRIADIEKFWTDLKGKAPIVEPYPGDAESVLVTFVQRSTAPYVGMFGGPSFREKPLVRLTGTDLFYLSARMPKGSRVDYAFITTDGPPPYRSPYRKDRADARYMTKHLDPNNPTVHFDLSRLELPGAKPQPFAVEKPDVAKGKMMVIELESSNLKEKRKVGIYTPAGYDSHRRYPLVIAFDGEQYGLNPQPLLPLPTIVDNMIAAQVIPPIVVALVANQGVRERDLTGSSAFSAFVAEELVPKLRADYRAGMTAADTIVTGASFGGLCSLYTALHHSSVIGNALSQSGSFQFKQGALDSDVFEFTEGGWLTRDYAKSKKLPLQIYLDVGRFEENLTDSNRHMRDVLIAKGYPVTYREFSGGHDFAEWRGTISEGLVALLQRKSVRSSRASAPSGW